MKHANDPWDSSVYPNVGRASSRAAGKNRLPIFQAMEPRLLLAADVILSEFMAVNESTLADEDGDYSDWVELYNAGDQAQSLDGWSLTDDDGDLRKWRIPDGVTMTPGQRLVIFASDKDRADAGGQLHTNFKLSGNGEYLALVDEIGELATELDPFPGQLEDISYGVQTAYGEVLTLIAEGASGRVHVPTSGQDDAVWMDRTFDDSSWTWGPTAVGYDTGSEYDDYIETDVETEMYDVTSSVYLRIPFQVQDASEITSLQLAMRYDDGFAAYLNGELVAMPNAASPFSWESTATQSHDDSEAVYFEELDISAYRDALRDGDNVLAIQGMNLSSDSSDLLIEAELTAATSGQVVYDWAYFSTPTPGSDNGTGVAVMGPIVSDVSQPDEHVPVGASIDVTARVVETFSPVNPSQVYLNYRVMYGGTSNLRMYDDGLHGDGTAGDEVYGASIPGGIADPGEMVRWYVTARDTAGRQTRAPMTVPIDPTNHEGGPEYFGAVIDDPAVRSDLDILEWFSQDPGAANTRTGTRSSLYYQGEFYDNVFTRVRGGSTAGQPNPSHKFDMNSGYHFRYDPDERRSEEFNLNTMASDKSYMRQILSYDLFRDSDSEYNVAFPLRVQQNGQFYAVETFIEQTDRDFLKRNGYDDNGVLYKAVGNGGGLQADRLDPPDVEKKTHKEETSHQDLKTAIDAFWNYGDPGEVYMFDNWNMPSVINYMAVKALIQDTDHGHKNIYIYFDRADTEEWTLFPWDHDLTWGRTQTGGVFNDTIYSSVAYSQPWNRVISSIFPGREHYKATEMFFRRLRSLVDDYIFSLSYVYGRISELKAKMGPDIELHVDRWYDPWPWGEDQTLNYAIDLLKIQFIGGRSQYFQGLSELPSQQTVSPGDVQIGTIEYDPSSGNQDEEYIEVENTTGHAIDVSGWRIESGRVDFTFRGGTVITANSSLYVSPDKVAFRDRSTGPRSGQRNLVIGHHHEYLNNTGGTVVLYDELGNEADTTSYSGAPSLVQDSLRITEVMYNPADPTPTEVAAGFVNNDGFEFIELQNTGVTTLDLSGVEFVDGISFDFDGWSLPAGERLVLAADSLAFQTRYPDYSGALGEYRGNLANEGEQLALAEGTDIFLWFDYNDGEQWPDHADGLGASLVVQDPMSDYNLPSNWLASSEFGGTPGSESVQREFGVVINEVLTHTDLPLSDSIELYNTGTQTVDLEGWFLSDSSGNLKFEIPAGTTLDAGDYIVFDETDFNPSGGVDPDDFALNSAHGESVWLVAVDGGELFLADHVEFGAASNAVSFGRWPNESGMLYPMASLTLGSANSGPREGSVVISEIMYNSGEDYQMDDLEYVEVYNTTDAPIDLGGWRLRGGVDYDFSAGTVLPAHAAAAVLSFNPADIGWATKLAEFRAEYGVGQAAMLLGAYEGKLENSGETLRLLSPDQPPLEEPDFTPYVLVDEVTYDDESPWPFGADGYGHSLHRLDPIQWGQDVLSWEGAAPKPAWFGDPLPGDLVTDGVVDAADIDYLRENFGNPTFDLDGNSLANEADVAYLLETILETSYGDANLDGRVADSDYTIWADHYMETGIGWAEGDYNGTGVVTEADYTIWADNYTSVP
jgi:CotH protein/lamin tail-like protein